ncbi:23S rRNA (adenine(1618)-N(6))-methyltransferase RlmF [Flavobacteriaceae bacterium]|nr:23S rRNA (adenine(1618)-N(6))-methyltransferase RlmF [Flavobacteriaceae bacterium]MDC1266146.1 23S rRNA (adenine(1618)-N(6))-methyltransferase RlmF [Flavobacteriaceae bacterium]
MHLENPYSDRYDLKRLAIHHPLLQDYIVLNPSDQETIDFSNSAAVYELNKAMLLADFKVEKYELPMGYLIPPVPGRLEYLLQIREFLSEQFNIDKNTKLRGLDIGSGANGIYCILGLQHFNWTMVGAECDANSVEIAKANMQHTKSLKNKIEIRHQENKSFLFKNIIKTDEQFDFTVCNPPFHTSKEEAFRGSQRKINNLGREFDKKEVALNFEGQANELWCNGGEALFIKRLIKESIAFKNQVKVFSTLVSKTDSLASIDKQLKKAKANSYVVPMDLGNKKSRIVLWWFDAAL